jgi:signal peptidase I
MSDTTELRDSGFVGSVMELIVIVAAAAILAFGIKTFVVQPFLVPSGSLEPTVMTNDRVLVNKFIYRFEPPRRGDIVVFSDPYGKLPALLKRVVAVGGDTVDVKDGHLWLNGKELIEPYVHGKPTEPGTVPMPLKVPAGDVFLMGDNRPVSGDARFFGPQPVSHIEGKAFAVYWPLTSMRGL